MVEGKRLGKTQIVKHKLYIEDDQPPIAQRTYRENEKDKEIIKEEIKKMLRDKIIRESHSPWCNPHNIPLQSCHINTMRYDRVHFIKGEKVRIVLESQIKY